jgi:hypothetical protein
MPVTIRILLKYKGSDIKLGGIYEMRGRNLPSGKMVLGFFVIFLLLVLGLEGITRFLTRGPKDLNPYYVEISKDFPELMT